MTAGGVLDMLRHAWETLPGIYDLPLEEVWAGLRPTSRDDAPILGPVTGDHGVAGLVMATGHHRAGILLAPVTAKAISDYVLSGSMDDAFAPFAPERFAA
jgi:glycine oxidase